MAEVEIGIGKTGRRGYGFDDIAVVPSRRTRDREEISLAWEIDAYRFELPLMAAAMDSVTSPRTAVEVGRLGAVGVLNLEGLWTRYADPAPLLEEIAVLDETTATRRLQQIYTEPIKPELIGQRIQEIKDAGVVTAASLTPQKVTRLHRYVLDAGIDLFVIQGTVVSAEHVSSRTEPLNLKKFIHALDVPVIVGGCASFSTALHLMRTGAAGLIVGVGTGHANGSRGVLGVGVPMATAIADAAGARMRYLDESGGRYVHVIADGGMTTGGDVVKAIACGADAVMLGAPLARAVEAPGRGAHWGMAAFHPELPRGRRVNVGVLGTLREILLGPAPVADGTANLFGALRSSMATTGYGTLKEFQTAEVMVTPGVEDRGQQRAVGADGGR